MIVSHRHKFIFIKPQKTAGTSVELLLSRICGKDDIITPLGFDPDPNVRQKYRAKDPQNYFRAKPLKYWEMRDLFWLPVRRAWPNLNYREHLGADKIREYVGQQVWDSYRKISIVRNPWDHAVSWYKWQAHYGFGGTVKGDFYSFLKNNYRPMWEFYSVKSLYCIDLMIRFESLEEDVKVLSDHFPELAGLDVPKTKDKVRDDNGTYRDYYVEDSYVDMVAERSLNVIKRFGYEF